MSLIQSIKNLTKYEKVLWLFSIIGIVVSFLISGGRDWWTLIGSVTGATALIFVAKGDVLGQVLTVLFSLLYAVVSFGFHYYGEMLTYLLMSGPMALAATISWLKHPYKEREVEVNHVTKKSFAIVSMLSVVVTVIFYFILKAFNTPNLGFSTLSITTSFFAASFVFLRSPYYGVAYGCNDIVLIVLWVLATLEEISYLPMVLCFVIFFINDIYGFVNWSKIKERQREELTRSGS